MKARAFHLRKMRCRPWIILSGPISASAQQHQLARSAERIFERCGLLETHPTGNEAEVFREVADYDCAMAKSEASSHVGISISKKSSR